MKLALVFLMCAVAVSCFWAAFKAISDHVARRRGTHIRLAVVHCAPALSCTCPARLGECDCAVNGARNPRGAGRGRVVRA